jgi:DNA-binding MurR/RpiR family transcriptional regulator
MSNPFDLMAAIKQAMPELKRAERSVAELVLSDYNFILESSNAKIALQAEVSEPTVTRFCRRMGCDGLPDFKLKLAQSTAVGERFIQIREKDYKNQNVVERVVNGAHEAVSEVAENISLEAVEKAASAICAARRVLAIGSGGGSTIIAEDMQYRLFRLDVNVLSYPDSLMQKMVVATLKEQDVIVLFSASGLNKDLLTIAEMAKVYDVKTIAITRKHSKLAMLSDIAIEVNVPEHEDIFRPTTSRYAMMVVNDIVSTSVGYMKGDSVIDDLRRIKFFLVTNRDEDDSQPLGD